MFAAQVAILLMNIQVATHYATMRETAYMEKEKFKDNFWRGFRQVLGKNHVIKKLELCDFTPIWEHLQAQKEAKKNVSREVSPCRIRALHQAKLQADLCFEQVHLGQPAPSLSAYLCMGLIAVLSMY